MRDFQRDVVTAALAGKPLPSSVFSWSTGRHNLFSFCRRAYFLRYYLAQGGWNEFAHPLAKTAYLEKHLPTFSGWQSNTFGASVTAALAEASRMDRIHLRIRSFQNLLLKNMQKSITDLQESLLRKSYLQDPKLPGFLEYYHEEPGFLEKDTDVFIERLLRAFATGYAVLLDSDFMEIVGGNTYTGYRFYAKPFIEIPRKSFSVWLKAGAVYTRKGSLNMLRFTNAEETKELAFARSVDADLWNQYVWSKNPFAEAELNTFFFSEKSAEFLKAPSPISSEEWIHDSVQTMLSHVDSDGMVRAESFPKTEDTDRCRTCSFRHSCARLSDAIHKI